MKQVMLFKTMILSAIMMVLGLSFTACGDDEGEGPIANGHETIKMTYSVTLSDDWYKYFDVEVSYAFTKGEMKSEAITMDWGGNFSIPASAAPEKYIFKVVAKPKADAPDLDPEVEMYELAFETSAEISAYFADGSQDDAFGFYKSDSQDMVLDPEGMAAFIKEEQEVFSFEELADQ